MTGSDLQIHVLWKKLFNGLAVIHAVSTSGEKFISSVYCVAKEEKSKRVPELGGRDLTDLSPDVLTAHNGWPICK